jgi:choline kinase
MVDHVFAEPALPKLTAAPLVPDEAGRVLVDRAPVNLDLSDATRVRWSGAPSGGTVPRVTAIGKQVAPWDAIDAGCFLLTHDVFEALRQVPRSEPRTVSSGMRRLAAGGRLSAADLEGIAWADVDTPADRDAAERLVQRLAAARVR